MRQWSASHETKQLTVENYMETSQKGTSSQNGRSPSHHEKTPEVQEQVELAEGILCGRRKWDVTANGPMLYPSSRSR